MKRVFLLLLILFIRHSAWSQFRLDPRINIGGLDYHLFDDTHEAMVADNNTWDGELVLPSTVTNGGKEYTVTKISWMAFNYCQTITSITIPETVRKIDCLLPQQGQPFDGCDHLESVIVEKNNQWFCSEDGVLFSKDKTKLICYPAASKRQNYTVPDGVESIGEGAFGYCVYLVSVSLPNTVTNLDRFAFHFSEALKKVVLSDNIPIIRQNTFQCCGNLEEVIFPSSLKTIEEFAFHRCTSLVRVHFPDKLEETGNMLFHSCTSLRMVDFPASIRKIGDLSFYGCALDTVVIRGKLENVSESLFQEMHSSPEIFVPTSDISMYTLLNQGSVHPLDEYVPNAIDDVNIIKMANHECFDLSGRRLAMPPAKGVYIEDRRVRVKD